MSGLYSSGTNVSGIIAISLLFMGGKEINTLMLFTMLSMMEVVKFSLGLCVSDALTVLTEAHVGIRRMETFLLKADATRGHGSPEQYKADATRGHGSPEQYKADATRGHRNPEQYEQTEASNSSPSNGTAAIPVHFRGRRYRAEVVRQESIRKNTPVLLSFSRLPLFSHSKPKRNLSMDSICCSWTQDGARDALNKVSMSLTGEKLVVVTGPVGSGKSSLLMAILQELPLSSGHISCSPSRAFVSQIPWVFSGTFRENVLFGQPFNETKYNSILSACDLLKDVRSFPKGDLSHIGERGVSLSGGQRARVSLARATYSEADVFLLDDPLSAVDAKVGKHIFENCICGMLSGRLRILTTHQLQYLKRADHVVVLHRGEVSQQGPYAQIQKVDIIGGETNRTDVSSESPPPPGDSEPCDEFSKDLEGEEEERLTGSVSWRVYWTYLRAGSPAFLIVGVVLLLFSVEGTRIRSALHVT